MPNLGLSLGLQYLPTIGSNATGGNLPVTRLADNGAINITGNNATYPITYLADNGAIALTAFDAKAKITAFSDNGLINISAFDASVSGADNGTINLLGNNATAKVGIRADTGVVNILGNNATAKISIISDNQIINLAGYDATVKVSISADYGGIDLSGEDAEWEEDFVANYVENVTINANTQNSSAFSIAGKMAWVDVPITTSARTCTLQTLAADGSTWISTGISWTTSNTVNTLVNSETLAKIAGKTGPSLNNFRLQYDSSLTGSTTHIVRSRT